MDGLIIGPESEQKDLKDFNKKVIHQQEDGSILNLVEDPSTLNIKFKQQNFYLKERNNLLYFSIENVDTIAFVLFATNVDDLKRIGLTYEYIPGIDKSIISAFTSIIPNDFVESKKDLRELVTSEVLEQCGFKINFSNIEYLGKSLVSNHANEFCHLFGISVDKTHQTTKTTNKTIKKNSGFYWAKADEISELEDWKSQLIVIKRLNSKKKSIIINKK